MTEDIEERVRARAHLIWEREGRPEGREQEHWDQALAELAEEAAAGADAPKKRAVRKAAPTAADGEPAPAPKRRGPGKPKAKSPDSEPSA